jgi:two-component system sensor histidine kinase RegB
LDADSMSSAGHPPPTSDHRAAISLDWLVRLRWWSVLGQAATVATARALLGPELGVARLLTFIGILAASNAAMSAFGARSPSPRALCGAALALDTLLLTGLLHATGGPYNPFSVLYLVYITLAAVVLRARWTWFLALLASGCYGFLFASHIPLEHLDHSGPEMSLHLHGMWLAFAVAAALTAYFVVRLTAEIEQRDAALAEARERAARHERLAAVTTLAAGAAHELGTPLATIAVAAKELERSIRHPRPGEDQRLAEDAALIRSELDRCRAILNRLAANSGQVPGEAPQDLNVRDVMQEIVAALPAEQRSRLTFSVPRDGAMRRLPRAALEQIAHNLLRNAFEATGGRVALSIETRPTGLTLRVQDEGPGMSPEVLARVGEPFFSTKGPGQGLGLGVFIARTLSEQMGGRLSIDSTTRRGTTALVEIPVESESAVRSHAG